MKKSNQIAFSLFITVSILMPSIIFAKTWTVIATSFYDDGTCDVTTYYDDGTSDTVPGTTKNFFGFEWCSTGVILAETNNTQSLSTMYNDILNAVSSGTAQTYSTQ